MSKTGYRVKWNWNLNVDRDQIYRVCILWFILIGLTVFLPVACATTIRHRADHSEYHISPLNSTPGLIVFICWLGPIVLVGATDLMILLMKHPPITIERYTKEVGLVAAERRSEAMEREAGIQ